MTIEIRQLVIRAVVDQAPAQGAGHEGGVAPVSAPGAPAAGPEAHAEFQALVAACVREVLRRLERARER